MASQQELAANRSRSQPAACCLLFCPRRLSPPRGTSLPHCALLVCAPTGEPAWKDALLSPLLTNFRLATLTTTTTTHLLPHSAAQAGHCPPPCRPYFCRASSRLSPWLGQLGLRVASLVLLRIFSLRPCAAGEGEGRRRMGGQRLAPRPARRMAWFWRGLA